MVTGTPEKIGPYGIVARIGVGGMGMVYLARDERLDRKVAIKTLLPEMARDSEARARFLREARAAAAFSHPNLTQIYDYGEEGDTVYFAMEYLQGQTVEELMKTEGGRLVPKVAVDLIRQAATGLKAAAQRDILHRDIKPANLILTSEGTLKVSDFGLAKRRVSDTQVTQAGQFMGTPHYISPEQAQAQPCDRRSDIYSLGATLYQMLSGKTPFDGISPMSVVLKHINEQVPPLRGVAPHVPYPLTNLVHRMLSKHPDGRPADYDALLAELDAVQAAVDAPTQKAMAARPLPKPVEEKDGSGNWLLWVSLPLIVMMVGWFLFGRNSGVAPTTLNTRTFPGPTRLPVGAADPGARTPPGEELPPGIIEVPAPVTSEAARTMLAPAQRASLEVAGYDHEFTADGGLRVFGQVANTGHKRSNGARVKVTLHDGSGGEVERGEVEVQPALLGPGETGAFEIVFANPGEQVTFKIELSWLS